jgi:hypothetical protein
LALVGCVGNYGGNHDGRYYDSCYDDSSCIGGLVCPFHTGPVCTTRCLSTDDCVRTHGEGSFCSISGVCFSACTTLADCPGDTQSCMEGACVPRTLGL